MAKSKKNKKQMTVAEAADIINKKIKKLEDSKAKTEYDKNAIELKKEELEKQLKALRDYNDAMKKQQEEAEFAQRMSSPQGVPPEIAQQMQQQQMQQGMPMQQLQPPQMGMQQMGMPQGMQQGMPPMAAYGGYPQQMMGFGGNIAAGLYGAAEGVLDTATFGLTDKLTDKIKFGNAEAEAISEGANIFGNVAGAVINPTAVGTAVGQSGKNLKNIANTGAIKDNNINKALNVVGTGAEVGSMFIGDAGSAMEQTKFAGKLQDASQNPYVQAGVGMANNFLAYGGNVTDSLYQGLTSPDFQSGGLLNEPMPELAYGGRPSLMKYENGGDPPPTFEEWKRGFADNTATEEGVDSSWYINQTAPAQLKEDYNNWISQNYATDESGNLIDRMNYMPTETQTVSVENNPNYGKINPEVGSIDLNRSSQTIDGDDFSAPKKVFGMKEAEEAGEIKLKEFYEKEGITPPPEYEGQGIAERNFAENSGLPGGAKMREPFYPEGTFPPGGNEDGQGFNWKDLAYNAFKYAPVGYNLIQGLRKPTQFQGDRYANPYEQRTMDLMANRTFDINPQLTAATRAANKYQNDILNVSKGNVGTYLGNRGQAANQEMAATANLYAQKNNIENQYKQQQAAMLARFGTQQADSLRYTDDFNEASKAAKRAHLGTAATQLSQGVQSEKLMANLLDADKIRANMLRGAYFGWDPETQRLMYNNQNSNTASPTNQGESMDFWGNVS
jgi:hypothetical protein